MICMGVTMASPVKLRDYPGSRVHFICEKCGRGGQYSKQHLIWRFGPDVLLADLRSRLANCESTGEPPDGCGARLVDKID